MKRMKAHPLLMVKNKVDDFFLPFLLFEMLTKSPLRVLYSVLVDDDEVPPPSDDEMNEGTTNFANTIVYSITNNI